MRKINNPLVSIIVVTYNSSKYVLETLESAKAQTYQNIELIVSDDCSTDNTIEICNNWININKDRFVRIELLMIEKNTGVSANCNRGYRAANGEWIKSLAGDDLLFPNAISEYLNFVKTNHYEICCCKIKLFGDEQLVLPLEPVYENHYKGINKNLKSQQQMILRELFVPALGLFLSKSLYNSIGGYDETYPFCDDWPFILRILDNNNQIHLIDKYLVYYRVHAASLCHNTYSSENIKFYNDFKIFFYKKILLRSIKSGNMLNILYTWNRYLSFLYQKFVYKLNNRYVLKYGKYIYVFSPLLYLILIKKITKRVSYRTKYRN
jgi:alpha-1,3-rhamnosyltransferase